jgi:hypothetical protein
MNRPMIFVVFLAVIALAVVARVSLLSLRRHRMAAELKGDWWPRFEREFQTYASLGWRSARDAERGD